MRVLMIGALALLAGCGAPRLVNTGPTLDVARAALNNGAPDVALTAVDSVLHTQKTSAEALIVRGDALTALGRTTEAKASYQQALGLDANSAGARLGLGRLAVPGDPKGAELLFLEVLSREPRNAAAFNDLGIAEDLEGRHEDAQANYRRALGLAPTMQAATVNLALSLGLSGHAAQALDLLRPLAGAPDASPRVRQDFALVAELAGDHAAAAAALNALTADQTVPKHQ